MKIELAPRAIRDAERHASWWRDNRPGSPRLFEDEPRTALDLIREMPKVGSVYWAIQGLEHRRVLMPRTRFHVYYRVATDRISIVAVWSAIRGRGPLLR